jgi:hypothetical protein
MKPSPDPHYRHRFPAEIISQAVWLYHVFSLSLRDVELLLAERGVVASYETIRRWCKKFGQAFAGRLRRRRPRAPGALTCESGTSSASDVQIVATDDIVRLAPEVRHGHSRSDQPGCVADTVSLAVMLESA